jgi:exodeoxyribonuclease-3
VKILTWNVNGVRARQAELQQLLAAEQPDVVCLQEIKAAPDQVPTLLLAPEGYWCYWHGAKGYSGVALLVRCSVRAESPGFSHPPFDLEQRIVVADFGGTKVASVYVPNGGKDFDVKLRFLDALAEWTTETSRAGQALVIWYVGRDLDPGNDALFTWWAPWRNLRQRNIGWRIDYVLASQGISTRARSSVSMREFGTSDHAPVVVTFDGVLS